MYYNKLCIHFVLDYVGLWCVVVIFYLHQIHTKIVQLLHGLDIGGSCNKPLVTSRESAKLLDTCYILLLTLNCNQINICLSVLLLTRSPTHPPAYDYGSYAKHGDN